MAELTYRHPAIDDVEAIVDVINTSNKDDPLWDVETTDHFRKNTFEHDDYDAEGYWVVLVGELIIGYGGARVIKRRLEQGQNDGWINIWVLQDYRGKGIENELTGRSKDFLRRRGIAQAKLWDLANSEWRQLVLNESGFKICRYHYIMINTKQEIETLEQPEGLEFEEVLLKDASDEILQDFAQIGNESFAHDPEFTRMTLEYLKGWKESTPDFNRINFGKIDDKRIGICLSTIEVEFNRLRNIDSGWIGFFGVLKDYRRRGIGRSLLVNGIEWLRDQGMDTFYLGVEADNPRALNLYKSVGFEVEREGMTYCLNL